MLCQIMDKSESGGGEIPSSVFSKIRLHIAAFNAALGLAQALKFSSPSQPLILWAMCHESSDLRFGVFDYRRVCLLYCVRRVGVRGATLGESSLWLNIQRLRCGQMGQCASSMPAWSRARIRYARKRCGSPSASSNDKLRFTTASGVCCCTTSCHCISSVVLP